MLTRKIKSHVSVNLMHNLTIELFTIYWNKNIRFIGFDKTDNEVFKTKS